MGPSLRSGHVHASLLIRSIAERSVMLLPLGLFASSGPTRGPEGFELQLGLVLDPGKTGRRTVAGVAYHQMILTDVTLAAEQKL